MAQVFEILLHWSYQINRRVADALVTQGASGHSIDLVVLEYSSFSTRRVGYITNTLIMIKLNRGFLSQLKSKSVWVLIIILGWHSFLIFISKIWCWNFTSCKCVNLECEFSDCICFASLQLGFRKWWVVDQPIKRTSVENILMHYFVLREHCTQ